MKSLFFTLVLAAICATGYGQTLKSLMYNTTNGEVAYAGTNALTFTNDIVFQQQFNANIVTFEEIFAGQIEVGGLENTNQSVSFSGDGLQFFNGQGISFTGTNAALAAATTRTNLGLGASNQVEFLSVALGTGLDPVATIDNFGIEIETEDTNTTVSALNFVGAGGEKARSNTRAKLGLGATNDVTFSTVDAGGLRVVIGTNIYLNFADDGWESSVAGRFDAPVTVVGDLQIRNDFPAGTSSNGLLFIYRTNNEPFLGLANLIASNNTTISNETLFRVGTAEATNRSAQFGFRSTNTNGSGVAVFSVFGYNALMQIGIDASTNAVIFSGGGTNNEVMTLIRDGATEFARPIRFSTNASTRPSTNAPANTTNVAAWVEMRIGTNSYRVPLYQ